MQLIPNDWILLVTMLSSLGLLVVEMFMPGFGIPGLAGFALELLTVYLAYTWHGATVALAVLLISLAVTAVAVALSLRSAARGRIFRSKMVLKDTEQAVDAREDMKIFVGRSGTATTPLRPTGMAEFDGVRLNVLSEGDFIAAGTPVTIIRVDGSKVLVRA